MSARENEWLKPSSLLGIAGFVSLMWSGYQQFADSTAERISDLAARVKVLEADTRRIDRIEAKIDALIERSQR